MIRYLLVVFALVLAACGGGNTADTGEDAASDPPVTAATQPPATEAPAVDAPQTTEAPLDEPAAPGGAAGITLTIGDETWEFPTAFCAYYNAPAGEADSEWNVSQVDNGLQAYIADDEFGTLASVADIENGGNPTVSWEAIGDAVQITVNGNDVTATGTFTDGVNGGTAEGTLTATCLSWIDAS